MTVAPQADSSSDEELVLDPPAAVPQVTPSRAASTIKVDDATAARITAAVTAYVESLTTLEAQSPEFERKVASITRMGYDEIRRSSEASSRFLDRPTQALKQGPMAQGSGVSTALVQLRQQVEDLDPSHHLRRRGGFFLNSRCRNYRMGVHGLSFHSHTMGWSWSNRRILLLQDPSRIVISCWYHPNLEPDHSDLPPKVLETVKRETNGASNSPMGIQIIHLLWCISLVTFITMYKVISNFVHCSGLPGLYVCQHQV
jgi:hypothetical protein